MDQINIDNLKVFAHHGVYAFEQEKGQDFFVNAVFFLSLQKSGLRDDLTQSVSYADLADFIADFLTKNTYLLIEAAAEHLVISIFNHFPRIQKIKLEIRKPNAPVQQEFESVSVTITRKRHMAAIGLGSNMGDSKTKLKQAISRMREDICCSVVKESDFVISTPYGGVKQDDFVNGVVLLETYYEPEELLDFLHRIEKENGRERLVHWGPRTLDLDILLYDDLIMDTENLTIPHPDMQNRDFVLLPLKEIAPWYRHPLTGKTILQMAECISEKHIV